MQYAHSWQTRRAARIRARRMEGALEIAGISVMLGVCILLAVAGYRLTRPVECRVEMLTLSGDLYIVGRGDTGRAAWENIVWPDADLRSIETVCE